MPQDRKNIYKAEASGANNLFVILRNDWFDEEAWVEASRVSAILSESHPDFAAMILNVPRLRLMDFSSLKNPRCDYANQTHIDKRRVWLMTACAVHYN